MIKPIPKNEDGKKYINTNGLELVVVKKDERAVYLVFDDKELTDIEIENINELPVGTKCVGKVSSVSENINSAYIMLPDKTKAFLKNCKNIKCEQNVPVEIIRASSKGKLPSVSVIDEDISHRSDFSIISYGEKAYSKLLKKYHFDRIITDENSFFDEIKGFIDKENEFKDICIEKYNDSMVSLSVLYSVSQKIKDATSKTVWLKSGANIVIEETSAFTVIDVNSAKNDKGKEDSYFEINKEAANEIFRQMNLRNISGIILIDFINMDKQKTKELMEFMKKLAETQKQKTKVVDITSLGIAEVTRKKEGVTLSDICK